MKRIIQGKSICIIGGCVISLIFILLIFSPQNVDPKNIEWVTGGGGDNIQHYIGWRFFRNSPWNRYLLFMQNLNYPIGTSVIVTDSNPLFCLIFKIFRDVLPTEFQFNGIWIIISYLLIGFFSAEIGWELTESTPLTLTGTFFCVMNPVILQRALIHDTLTAHWIILAGIFFILHEDSRWNLIFWMVLTEVTLLIHIYFIPMLAFLVILQIISMIKHRISWKRIVILPVSFVVALVIGYYTFGYSHILPQSGSFGELSMNLNAFINPDSIPALLNARPRMQMQYEGFNYYGLGLIVMTSVGLVIGGKKLLHRIWPYLIPCFGLIFAAASNVGYFDRNLIYEISLSEKLFSLLSVFRSTGRLVWPLYYLVVFAIIFELSDISHGNRKKYVKILVTIILPCCCLLLQYLDLHVFYMDTAERFRKTKNSLPELTQDLIDSIPNDVQHLYCSEGDSKTVDALALFAADHQMTFNQSANARGIKHIYGGDELDLKSLSCSQIQANSAYIYLIESENIPALSECVGIVLKEGNGWKSITPEK